ncbi:MAG: hypothetical protein MUC35_04915 [Candidatus Margulisbacteria bacterium]|jgi:hypothetical protein|nr:hypothetical protein [Candidatus Margulisiibacteriota bacterium]
MDFNTTAFRSVRPVTVRLSAWRSPQPPAYSEKGNPLRAVVNFARFVGIKTLPAATLEKFRNDPYYRYCFYQLRSNYTVYLGHDASRVSGRLRELLLSPDSFNDRDLVYGLKEYLNNFPGYLPGGAYRVQYGPLLGTFPVFKKFFRAVDAQLGEAGARTALALFAAVNQERAYDGERYTARAEYLKFCLMVFDQLVASGQFTPQELWQ